ncbi:MAG: EAL domain-containing protein [Candidatus Thiodiazotropha weberae]|nr:EAL domain-containing protein [Candidatus Thiodiazotropha weberae]
MKPPKIGHLSIGFGVTLLISLGIVGYLSFTGDQMARRHAPQIDAAMEIKHNATMAHLWFEEIISGDRNELIEDVWHYLDESDWYARALLEGGSNQEGTFVPLQSKSMRQQIESVRKALDQFRRIAEERYGNYAASLPGSGIDQKFDQVFAGFIDQADQVKSLLQASINAEMKRFEQITVILVVMLLTTGIIVAVSLFRLEGQRTHNLLTIEQRNKEIESQNNRLDYLAHFDSLCGLPNRTLFIDRLETAITHAKRKLNCVAMLFIDLDRFKSVNDRLGHDNGDKLLTFVAKRIQQSLREDDSVARLGGDEFTVILADLDDRDQATAAAQSVAENITHELAKSYNINGHQVELSASIGIAIYPYDAQEADELVINADHAMYEAKKNTRDSFLFYSDEINKRVKRTLQVEHDLRTAIREQQFTVYFQPQWDLHNDTICGFEALVRWQHPTEGLMLPGEFIQIAEYSGQIAEIDLMVLKMACQQQQQWLKQGLKPGKMAVNISAMLFSQSDIAKIVSSNITEFCLSGHELELELTESAMLHDINHTKEVFKQLGHIGIPLAIDDFGTGYSSMAYLHNLPAKVIKIDRTFIRDIERNKTGQAIVQSMLELAENMGMEAIAEGIETNQEHGFVRSTKCRIGQGYLLGRPMTAEQAHSLLISQQDENVTLMPPREQ